MPYVGDLNKIPHGWALCDGNNGTPNLKGMFLRGWGQQIINGNTYSATTVKNYQLDAIKDTFGKGSIVTTSANINVNFSNKNPATGVFSYETDWGYYVGGDVGYANHALKIKFDMTAGQNTSNEFRPINYTVYYIMRII